MVPSRQSCFAALAAGLLWLCGVLPAHALHAWPSDGIQNIPISPVKTRVGDFSFAASGRLSWRHGPSPANTPGSWGCDYETASGRAVWNARDPNYYSFAGGEPIMSFDADGRIANNFYQNGSSTIQDVRLAGSLFTSYADSSDSYVLGTTAAFIGQALNDIAGRNTPATYVNQAESDYTAQGGGATGALGVANRYNPTLSFYNAFSGIDAINGSQLSGVQQGQAWLGSFATVALLGTGFAETPAAPSPVPPVLQATATAALDPVQILQNLTDQNAAALNANPSLANSVLSPAENLAAQTQPFLNPVAYGNAIQRLVNADILNSPTYSSIFDVVGGPNNPDYVGMGPAEGLNFDITTPGQVGAHLARPGYGQGLNVITYQRAPGWTLPPQTAAP